MQIPDGYDDLFDDGSRAFLVLAMLRGAAQPVAAPVWFVTTDQGLLFTSEEEAAKVRDLRARPLVGGVVMAEGEHVRYVSVRGRAVELPAGTPGIDGDAVYRRIVRRYEGHDPTDPFDGVLFRLEPDRLTGYDYRDLPA